MDSIPNPSKNEPYSRWFPLQFRHKPLTFCSSLAVSEETLPASCSNWRDDSRRLPRRLNTPLAACAPRTVAAVRNVRVIHWNANASSSIFGLAGRWSRVCSRRLSRFGTQIWTGRPREAVGARVWSEVQSPQRQNTLADSRAQYNWLNVSKLIWRSFLLGSMNEKSLFHKGDIVTTKTWKPVESIGQTDFAQDFEKKKKTDLDSPLHQSQKLTQ